MDYTQGIRLAVESVKVLDDVRKEAVKKLIINVQNHDQVEQILTVLPQLIGSHKGGQCAVSICYQRKEAKAELALGQEWHVNAEPTLISDLKKLCGFQNIEVCY